MVTATKWVLAKQPDSLPTVEDFKMVTEDLPALNDGEYIVQAEWVSVDPYIRYRIRETPVGDVITSGQVAKVIESKNSEFPVGTTVVGYVGWRTHTLLPPRGGTQNDHIVQKLPSPVAELSTSTALGVLGMPGQTAYFGLLDVCKPKPGDVVVVNAAAGVVGSLVCQIAKIKGCKVIAFAGTDEKVSWLRELGVDVAANYKTQDIVEVIKGAAPGGVNCYFDNVGGEFSSKVISLMAPYGSVAICGAISTYNDSSRHIGRPTMCSPLSESTIIWKQLRIEGFLVSRWISKFPECLKQMREWIDQGKLKYKETVTEGFENTPKAFIGLFTGANTGKAVVKV
ncbi:Alcohol dehydrogenase C-terminal [Trinorchestia longiramus]|nr:Alcohol dehydrogenase C-terminal [Trinorchestia longiramus]